MKAIYKKKSKKQKKQINPTANKTKKRKTSTKAKSIPIKRYKNKKPNRHNAISQKSKRLTRKPKKRTPHNISISPPLNSYNELLISNIINKTDKLTINPYSLILHSLIINSNNSNRRGAYNAGKSIGKVLYHSTKIPTDTTISDSLQHVVEFFEQIGNKYITYILLPHQIVFNIGADDNVHIGANIHIFESGIISGFISSLLHNNVNVIEERCIHNDSNKCIFVSHTKFEFPAELSKNELNKFLQSAVLQHKNIKSKMSSSYLLLMLSLLENIKFSSYAYKFSDKIGREIYKINESKIRKNNQTDFIIDGIKLFAIGSPTMKKGVISIKLNKEVSKREVIKLIASFIGGFMNKYPLVIDVKNNNGAYTLRFKR